MLRPPRRISAGPLIHSLVVGLAVLFVALQVHGYTKLSPVDELQHIDYLYRAPAAPAPADRIGQEAMRQQDCRGVDAPGFGPPPCRPLGSFDPATFQEKGYNTAAANAPVYYTVTRGVAEVLQLVSPADDLVTAGRLAGGLWFGCGLVLTYLAGRRRGIGPGPLSAVTLLLAASPALIFPGATITPDAMGLAAGALLLLTTSWWEERPTAARTAVLVAAAVTIVLIKMTYLVGVAAICFYLLLRRARGDEASEQRGTRRRWTTAAVLGGSAIAAAGAWMAFVSSRPSIPPGDLPDMATRFQTPSFPWSGLSDNSLALLQPLASPWVLVGSPHLTNLSTALVSLVLLAGTLAAALFASAPPREVSLGQGVVIAALIGSALLVTAGYLLSGSYFPLPARYGIALTAPMAIVTAASLRSRTSVAVLVAVALVAAVSTTVRLTTLP